MENQMIELFENLKDEGYVDVYFLSDQYDANAENIEEHGIKYDLAYDWDEFCRSQLKLDEESILLINQEDEKVFIKGNRKDASGKQEELEYQIVFQ